jgi:hypothetical protein
MKLILRLRVEAAVNIRTKKTPLIYQMMKSELP